MEGAQIVHQRRHRKSPRVLASSPCGVDSLERVGCSGSAACHAAIRGGHWRCQLTSLNSSASPRSLAVGT